MDPLPLRFSLRQLRYFVTAADVLSVSLAAKRQNISQPAISSALADLEEALGVQLFIRHHAQGLSLTKAGQFILVKARVLIKQAEELHLAAKDFDLGTTGTISLGCMTSIAPLLLPSLIRGFVARHPGVTFNTYEEHQKELLEGLKNGLLDVALTYDLDLTNDIEFRPLLTLPPYAILPRDYQLGSRKSISLAELARIPYVMLDLPYSREYFASLFEGDELRPSLAFKSSQPEMVRCMVANGLGFSILNYPVHTTHTVDNQEFATAQISEKLRALTLGVAYLQRTKLRAVVKNFTEYCEFQLVNTGSL